MKSILMALALVFTVNSHANFFQSVGKKYDVLFVVDDSADMTVINYEDGLRSVVSKMVGLNVHIGMITTSEYTPKGSKINGEFTEYSPVVSKSNIDNVVNYLMSAGYQGDPSEKFFPNIISAFENSDSANFFRKDSDLIIFIISTAVDQSEMSEFDFLKELRKYKSSSDVYIRAALTKPHFVNDEECVGENDSKAVSKLNVLMDFSKINVKMVSLCSKDWSSLIDFN